MKERLKPGTLVRLREEMRKYCGVDPTQNIGIIGRLATDKDFLKRNITSHGYADGCLYLVLFPERLDIFDSSWLEVVTK